MLRLELEALTLDLDPGFLDFSPRGLFRFADQTHLHIIPGHVNMDDIAPVTEMKRQFFPMSWQTRSHGKGAVLMERNAPEPEYCRLPYPSRQRRVNAVGRVSIADGNPQVSFGGWRAAGSLGQIGKTEHVPLIPVWPGFAINTIFYAAILWLPFGPFELRRSGRLDRGLCPTCAYPMGQSAVCTECGKPLPQQANATT